MAKTQSEVIKKTCKFGIIHSSNQKEYEVHVNVFDERVDYIVFDKSAITQKGSIDKSLSSFALIAKELQNIVDNI